MIKLLLLILIFAFNILCSSSETSMTLEASQTPLMQAAAGVSLDKLREELDTSGVNANAQDSQGRTALFIAAQEGKADNVRELLKRKDIDIHLADNDGLTPLQVAVTSGDSDTVNALLDASEKVDGKCKNIDQRDKKLQFTPLARALRSGNTEIIKLLLQAGADPKTFIRLGGKCLFVTELIKHDDKDASDFMKKYTRGLAVVNALRYRDLDYARELIKLGIDVNAKCKYGLTPLVRAAALGCIDITQTLINNKSDVNHKDKFSCTPLEAPARDGHKGIVELLIKSKADLNDQGNLKALYLAIMNGHRDIVRLLIDNKADFNAKNQYGNIALLIATRNGHKDIVDMLKKAGAQ